MLDNLQLIPGEAFTATGSFLEKLLDKISNAIGWGVIPKNTKKYRLEAEEYLIEQIMNDDKIPTLAKAAYISNARKVIRQYVNQCNICTEAIKCLSTETNIDNINELEDDWLEFFFDKAKKVGKEDMQIIWAKLLAKEVESPNSVSKQLLHILAIIDSREAESFVKLANFIINIGDKVYAIVSQEHFKDVYEPCGLKQSDIMQLVDIGLVQYDNWGYTVILDDGEEITYFDKNIDVGNINKLHVGNVALSKAGEELVSIITDKERIRVFEDYLPQILLENDIDEA